MLSSFVPDFGNWHDFSLGLEEAERILLIFSKNWLGFIDCCNLLLDLPGSLLHILIINIYLLFICVWFIFFFLWIQRIWYLGLLFFIYSCFFVLEFKDIFLKRPSFFNFWDNVLWSYITVKGLRLYWIRNFGYKQ